MKLQQQLVTFVTVCCCALCFYLLNLNAADANITGHIGIRYNYYKHEATYQ